MFGYGLIIPALALITGLVAYPFAMAIYFSLSDYWVGSPGSFIGLQNFRDILGNGDDAWLVRRGAEVAEELMAAGLYQQLKYLARLRVHDEHDARERHAAFGTDLRLLTSLSGTFYNFTTWTPRADPDHADRYLLEVSGARDFPETICWTNLGFINRISSEGGIGGRDPLWTWKRERPDLVVFRMTRAA